jgi:hypothetical protein
LGNRPGVQRLIEAALAGELNIVLVTDLSRLSRSTDDLNKLIDRLVAHGVRVIGVQEGYDSSRRGHKLQGGLSDPLHVQGGLDIRDGVKDTPAQTAERAEPAWKLQHLGSVLSINYSTPEVASGSYTAQAYDQVIALAAASGIAVNVSTGD